jgi:putative ABC transport system permease protein
MAVLLACLGIYGVMSLGVGARVSEFAIRLALGAQTGDVLRLVIRMGDTACKVPLASEE